MESFQEAAKQVEAYFGIVGIPLAFIYALTIVVPQARRRIPGFGGWYDQFAGRLWPPLSPKAKKNLTIFLIVLAAIGYAYCLLCGNVTGEATDHNSAFFHVLVSFSVKTYPFFIFGCFLAGAIERYMSKSRWLPKSMFGTGVFAALLPVCSCAAVPFSYTMMHTKRIPLRAVVHFMVIAPVLNPFVIVFANGMLGWKYVAWRILSVWVLGMVTGWMVEYFLGERDPEVPRGDCVSCKGCSSGGGHKSSSANSVLEATFNLIAFLTPYIILGMILGAAFTVFVPPAAVKQYLSSGIWGLVLASGIGVPIFLCSGEDVLILKPLMDMGLPMGHAIALTLAGNGICVSSIALLFPLFGKKATYWITAAFFIGSLLIGLGINALPPVFWK